MLGDTTQFQGEDYLGFAGIAPPMLQLLPVETHIAEKLHAYTLPRTSPNSRVRDLPDLALLATAPGPLNGRRVADAIDQTFRARGTHDPPTAVPEAPSRWLTEYANLASEQRLRWKTLEDVLAATRGFLDPVLRREDCGTWRRELWDWSGPDR